MTPAPHLPRARLVLARGEERDEVERAVAGGDHAGETAFRDAELLEERLRLVGFHSGGLGLDGCRDADGSLRQVRRNRCALLEVRDDDDGLERQRRDAAQVREVLGGELRVAQGRLRGERLLRAGERR